MSDQQINIQFVQEVRKRPLLYNTSLPEYTRRDLTEAAWDEVGKVMNFTGAACKERWKNLRTVYSRHVKRSIEEPSEKRKKYYLTDHMSFILRYMRPSAPSNHAVHSPESEDANSGIQQSFNPGPYSESLEDSCHDQEEDVIFPFVSIKPDPSEVEYQTSHDGMDAVQNEPDSARDPVSDRSYSSRGNGPGERILQNTENRPSLHPSTLETRRMFLLGLLDEVAAMSDAQMRSFKRKVLKLIDEVLEI